MQDVRDADESALSSSASRITVACQGASSRGRRFSPGVYGHFAIAGCIAALLYAGLSQLFPATVQSPLPVVSTRHLDLGSGRPNEILRGSFDLRNAGGHPLAFHIDRSCGCTELNPLRGTLGPGEAVVIAVGIRLGADYIKERTVNAYIATDSPLHQTIACAFTVACPAPLEATPAIVDFGDVALEDAPRARQEVVIRKTGAADADSQPLNMMQAPAFVTVVSSQDDGAGGLRLVLGLNAGKSKGPIRGAIAIHSGKDTFSVPVRANFAEAIVVVPSTVFLRRASEHSAYQTADLFILDNRDPPRLGALLTNECPTGVTIEEVPGETGARRRVRLRVSREFVADSDSHALLSYEGSSEQLRVQLRNRAGDSQ